MKYRIDKSDLLIENKLHSEGSVIELTKEQTKGIEEYLIPLNAGHSALDAESDSKSHPEPRLSARQVVEGSQTNSNKKTKTKRGKK
ncbi:MAG: hypothetical protein PVF17_03655 [Ignavibacteria bacterium]|jgi:hypothetical protein